MLLGVITIYLSYSMLQALIGMGVYNFAYLGLVRVNQVMIT